MQFIVSSGVVVGESHKTVTQPAIADLVALGAIKEGETPAPEVCAALALKILAASLAKAKVIAEGASVVVVEEVDYAESQIGQPLAWPRLKRDRLLAACDWTQQADVLASMAADKKAAWTAYRAALRNLPQTSPDPLAIIWPVAPA